MPMIVARQNHEKVVATTAAAEPAMSKVPMFTQTETIAFAGDLI